MRPTSSPRGSGTEMFTPMFPPCAGEVAEQVRAASACGGSLTAKAVSKAGGVPWPTGGGRGAACHPGRTAVMTLYWRERSRSGVPAQSAAGNKVLWPH
eukprot:5120933-Pyramimonas_sp.AAC.1